MATSEELEIHKLLQATQEKYIYFLLASVGACLAFALSQTKQQPINLQIVPLGISVLLWGLSFFCGCKLLQKKIILINANLNYLNAENGIHPISGQNPELINFALLSIKSHRSQLAKSASQYSSIQFYSFIIAVFCYIVWHVLVMWSYTC